MKNRCASLQARGPFLSKIMYFNKFSLVFLVFCFLKLSFVSPAETDNYQIEGIKEDDEGLEFYLNKNPKYASKDNLDRLHVEINFINDYRLRCKIKDDKSKRFEVPLQIDLDKQKPNKTSRLYDVEIGHNEDSVLKVIRRKTNTLIWSIDLGKIIFSDQFIQVQNELTSYRLMGLGEHMDVFLKDFKNVSKSLVLYNQGSLPRPNKPLYGSHPVYLNYESNSNAHTVFLLNSNAMEVILNTNKTITFRVLGGILDFHVNVGPTPIQAVSQYVSLVGKPPLVPYSALGFHLCRWGYKSLDDIKAVLKRTVDSGIPLDYNWADIDYMNQRDDFTVDDKNFAGLKEFVEELHSQNRKFGVILDPGLPENLPESEYPPFTEALKQDLLVRYPTGELATCKVWNREMTVFPDYSNPKAEQFWMSNLIKFNKKVDYDMLWIDMNEIACIESEENYNRNCSFINPPPYLPDQLKNIHVGTLCYNAKHYIGNHPEVHNLYAYFQANYTRNALKKMNKRPFIISRSTFSGSGRFTSHWTGDVAAEWTDLRLSISNMLEFNILGIPVVGADICGFDLEPTEELCARWQSLGAFYPFSRNHNTINTKNQDPVAMGPVVEESARYALKLRYSLLPLLYTELYYSSKDGRPVVNSLSLLYPEDENAFVEDQFLWGSSLMIIPIVEEGQKSRKVYLPPGIWYEYPSMQQLNKNNTNGTHVYMDIPLDRIKLAVKGGSILFTHQDVKLTTTDTRKGNFTLIVAEDENGEAAGDLYIDDGESVLAEDEKEYSIVSAKSSGKQLVIRPIVSNYNATSVISNVVIVGLDTSGVRNNFYVNGKVHRSTSLSSDTNVFEIRNLSFDLNKYNVLSWD